MKNIFAILFDNVRISTLISVATLISVLPLNAQAVTISYSGNVLAVEGPALPAITPAAIMAGTITYADSAVVSGQASVADIDDIALQLGNYCFHLDPAACTSGAFLVPITSIDSSAVTFAGGMPTGGSLSFTTFANSFGVFVTTSLDLAGETFFVDAGAGGTVSGAISAVPVPQPPGFWALRCWA